MAPAVTFPQLSPVGHSWAKNDPLKDDDKLRDFEHSKSVLAQFSHTVTLYTHSLFHHWLIIKNLSATSKEDSKHLPEVWYEWTPKTYPLFPLNLTSGGIFPVCLGYILGVAPSQ